MILKGGIVVYAGNYQINVPNNTQPNRTTTNEIPLLVSQSLTESQQSERQSDKELQMKEKNKQAMKQNDKNLAFTPFTNIPKGKALVYIYKPKTYGKEIFRVEANGEPITMLKRGGYYPYIAVPGKIVFTAKAKARLGNIFAGATIPKSVFTLNVEPDKIYYIKEPGGFKLAVRLDLVQVPSDIAEKEIIKCKLLPDYKPDELRQENCSQ